MKEASKKATSIWILALASAASFMISLDLQIVTTSLPTIRLHLGASIEDLEWMVNAYILTFAVFLLTGAALGDRFGRKRIFVIGIGLFVIASAACALSPSTGALIAARTIQGIGAAPVLPLALTLLSAAFPPEQRGRVLGIFASVTGLALIAGPVLGGAISGALTWQWIFWINVPVGLMIIALVLLRVPESFGPRTPLDIGGLLLVSAASLGLVWGLVRGNRAGWGSFEVVATLFAGGVLLVAFVAWELRVHAPMVPMRFFRSRAFSSGNVANFSLFASMGGALFFMAQFLQTAQGYGPLAAGLRLLPWTATLFVVAPIAGALVNRLGERVLIVVGLLAEATGMIWIALIASPSLPYSELVAPLILCGCGASLAIPATQSAVINSVATSEIGKASGAFNMLRQISAVFGVSILAAVFAWFGGFSSPLAFSNGFTSAIGIAAALGLVGAIAGLVLPGRGHMAVARTTVQASEIKEHASYSEPAQSSSL